MRLGGEKEGRAERIRLLVIIALLVGGFIAFQRLAPSLDIEGWLEDVATDLGDLTYLFVGLLAFAETGAFVGLVFPGETAVIIGGALAGQGENSVVLMLAIVWFCAWAGDTVSFLLGQRLGRGFVLRHGPKVRITEQRFAQVESYFQRHGGKTILIGRFIGLVRALAPFIAGSSGMTYRAFVPYSVLGTGLWAATFTLLGYFISENINEATELASRGIFVFGAVVGTVVALVLAIRYLRARENRQRLARRMEGMAVLRPLVAFGRRIEPEVRFVWHRVTPGGLGLEFTTLMAVLAVAVFAVVGFAAIFVDDPGPTPGDTSAIDVVDRLRSDWLTDIAKVVTVFGSSYVTLAVALVAAIVLATRRRWTEVWVLVAALAICHIAVPVVKRGQSVRTRGDAEGGDRASAAGGWADRRERRLLPERACRLLGPLHVAGVDDHGPGAARAHVRHGADRGRRGADGRRRAQPGVPRRPLLQRRGGWLGARRVGVRGLRGRGDGHRPLAAESAGEERAITPPIALGTEYFLFGGAALISVLAFAALILVPTIGSFGRTWEKATAVLVSIFVLLALLAIGIALGVAIVYFWDDINEIFAN